MDGGTPWVPLAIQVRDAQGVDARVRVDDIAQGRVEVVLGQSEAIAALVHVVEIEVHALGGGLVGVEEVLGAARVAGHADVVVEADLALGAAPRGSRPWSFAHSVLSSKKAS